MKTKKTLTILKKLIMVMACSGIINTTVLAQNRSIGITIRNINSGAGLGSVVSPQLSFRNNAHELLFGINIQKAHMNTAGFRAGYKLTLNSGDKHEVFLFFDAAYLNNAWLSNRTVRTESFMVPENSAYFKAARLNVLEQHVGFGVNFFKAGPVNVFGAIGAGFYNTMGVSQRNLFKDRDLYDASIQLNLGISIKIIQSN